MHLSFQSTSVMSWSWGAEEAKPTMMALSRLNTALLILASCAFELLLGHVVRWLILDGMGDQSFLSSSWITTRRLDWGHVALSDQSLVSDVVSYVFHGDFGQLSCGLAVIALALAVPRLL